MPRGTYVPNVVVDISTLTEDEWLDYRRKGIGGSDASIVMGVSHFRTSRDLYYDKVGIRPAVVNEDDGWLQKKMGHVLEELVAEVFTYKTGLEHFEDTNMYSHPKYPFMLADFDRKVIDADGKTCLLECKTCNYEVRDQWANDKVPYHYELQVRHYMAVANIDVAYIACLWGNNLSNFAWRRIERDFDFEDDIIEAEKFFWEENVLKRVEPEFIEKPDMALKTLAAYIGPGDPTMGKKILSNSFANNLEKYLALKSKKSNADAEVKRLDEEMKRLYIPIIEELGECCEGVVKSATKEFSVSYKPRSAVRITKENLEKLKVYHKTVFDEYASESTSRTFNVKEMKIS